MIEVPDFEGVHLWDRLNWAKKVKLDQNVQPEFVVVWEDQRDLDAPCKITIPSCEFVAVAMVGGILPKIDAYLRDKAVTDAYEERHGSQEGFSWNVFHACHPNCYDFADPMSQEEIIEYIVQLVLPTHVLKDLNRPRHRIVKRSQILKNRLHRDAWELDFADEQPIAVGFDKAKELQRINLINHFIAADRRAAEIEPYIKLVPDLEGEYTKIKAARPEISFDRLDRAKTLSDLDHALPWALAEQFFHQQEAA